MQILLMWEQISDFRFYTILWIPKINDLQKIWNYVKVLSLVHKLKQGISKPFN